MEPIVTQLRSGDLGFEPSSVWPQNSCSSPLSVWLGLPELVHVPGEFLTHPLLHLKPILFCTLGWTSRFLRNTALIKYPSCCGHICLSRGSFPSEWNVLSLLHPEKTKHHPPDPMCPLSMAHLSFPQLLFIRSHQTREGRPVCSLRDLCPWYLLQGPSQPTHYGCSLSAESSYTTLTWPPSAHSWGTGTFCMAFAFLDWTYWESRSFKKKVLMWRGVFFSQQGNIYFHILNTHSFF